MGFQFSLAAVLRIRCIAEEKEERLLQKIHLEISQTHETIAQTEATITEVEAMRESSLSKAMAGCYLHAFYAEVKAMKQTKKDLEEKMAKLEDLRDRQIKVYEAARRNREMLTNIRDAELSAYNVGIARGEQKMLDDNYMARRSRA